MKIGVISSTVFTVPPSGYAGLEMIVWQQAKGLAVKGHEVTLFAPDGSSCPGVTCYPFGPAGQIDEKTAYGGCKDKPGGNSAKVSLPGYWPLLKDFDVILDHSWQKWAVFGRMEGWLKAPVLLWSHAPVDTMYQSPPDLTKPCFVCISEDQANHLRGLTGKDVRVCYNGIDLDHYKPLGLPRTNRFLFLARFSSIKGPDLAIKACQEAGVGLDLIGDTSITNEPHYFEDCRKQCDGKQIRLVGSVSRGETVWWYSRAHAFLHPTAKFREPFGLAPVEAQACGLPVIAWDYGAMRETVVKGETGLLSKTYEELVTDIRTLKDVLDDRQDRTGERRRCREHAKQFSVQRMVDRVEALCLEAKETGGW